MPPTVVCAVDNDGYCTAGNGKSSCEYKHMEGVCLPPEESFCTRGGGGGAFCDYDTSMLRNSGCIMNDTECVVNPELECHYSSEENGCTETSRLDGCDANVIFSECEHVVCNTSGNTIKTCEYSSTQAGCVLQAATNICEEASGLTCVADIDGACSGGSSSACNSVPSVSETCTPDPGLICNAAASGEACAEGSSAACTWIAEEGDCVEEENSSKKLTYSIFLLILFCFLSLQF
jgi:hypothetical protein